MVRRNICVAMQYHEIVMCPSYGHLLPNYQAWTVDSKKRIRSIAASTRG
jgi:hypothetical protein